MFAFPTFLSFPWSLPLPSLPSISLPANIQRRFLSYVLKRSMGSFVKAGGLDVERIQAQISEGRVEIEGLEIDVDEINARIPPDLPVQVASGSLAKLNARLPFPNLWSAPLQITLDTLHLDLALVPPRNLSSRSKKARRPPLSPGIDLASSVTTAADEFLHEELDAYEEAELDRSIRQSLVLSQNDPFSEEVPGAFPFSTSTDGEPLSANMESTTVLAGLIERVLARLEFKVNNVRIRVSHEDPRYGGTFELRISEIRYADESVGTTEEEKLKTVRMVIISKIEVFMLPKAQLSVASPAPPRFHSTMSRSSSTSSTSSSSTASGEANEKMIMSMAVADLRHSMLTSVASGASIYQSALAEAPIEEDGNRQHHGRDSRRESRASTPTPTAQRDDAVLLLSFGTDPVVLRMTTTRPQSSLSPSQANNISPATPSDLRHSSLPAVVVEVSVGTVSVLILPSQFAILLSALQIMTRSGTGPSSTAQDTPTPVGVSPRKLEARLRVDALFALIVYDLKSSTDPEFASMAAQFWQKPSMADLPVGHLKLRLETLQASYQPGGYGSDPTPQHQHSITRRVSTLRKGLTPRLTVSLADFSIFEFLASAPSTEEDSPPGGSFPVLLFDSNLTKQYEHDVTGRPAAIPSPVFPEFDGIDWRNSGLQRKGAAAEKAWKVKQKGRGVLKGGSNARLESVTGPVILIEKKMSDQNPAIISTQPVHVFLDLSLVERLLPMLRHISPVIKHLDASIPVTPPVPRPAPLQKRSESYVLDDLDARAAKAATISRKETAVVECPMARLSIRCPAPPNRRGTWGDGAHLRSGIVTIDLHALHANLSGADEPNAKRKRLSDEEGGTHVKWEKMIFFFSRVPATKSSAFLVIGPLSPEPGDMDPTVLLPSVHIKSTPSAIDPDSKTSIVNCRIPSVQAQIRQTTIEGLQFFADDLTHWLDGAFGDGSRPKPRDELKMIGSRFFGSKASSSASSSAIEADDDDDKTSASMLKVTISETDVTLYVPRSTGPSDGHRILALRASDLNASIESNVAGRQETVVALSVMDATFSDETDSLSKRMILSRTAPFTLTAQNHPIVHLKFSSLTDGITGTQETSIKAVLSSFTFFVTSDITWVNDLAAFAKTPEGVFEDVVPSEITKIALDVYDGSIHLTPPSLTGAAVIVLGVLEVKTDIVSGADESLVDLLLGSSGLLVVDDMAAVLPSTAGSLNTIEAWKTAGYAQLVELKQVEGQLARDLIGSRDISVDIFSSKITITACADSLAYLGPFFEDLKKLGPSKDTTETVKWPVSLDESINVFASIDENAFNSLPEVISGADLIEDDLPTNLDYLDHTTRHNDLSADKSTGETLRSWQTTDGETNTRLHAEMNGETIKVLYHESFEVEEEYWDNLSPVSRGYRDETKVGSVRVRVHDCTVRVLLFEGYDWQRTRKAIEDEIKLVRRRLERIRQLLASGQAADESIEDTRSVLFNSVYIGFDKSREMDPAALLAAIDEELGDLGNDASSVSSWQTDFPSGHPNHSASTQRGTGRKTRLKGKRLTRSKKAQMEIDLESIRLDYDAFAPDNTTASRLHVTIGSVEILDHIKTSTWKKFLTEMKADSRGNVRETDAEMVRVELVGVRPSLPSMDEEFRLRAKVLPLRLHVDQDALDFLKRFFSFTSPGTVAPSLAKKAAADPFLQHVEIFPIELKLDYKPKRVDFAALREGRVIELMNFFHFDGAEMTLRHITLSGISGYTRLSATLQDLWTPDVKANQLADVISGVSPIRSMVNVGSGVADLILLPIEQYRKDGRVARGVQRGTNSFVRSTALEMMKLGAKLATGTQVILEKAEGVLGGRLGDEEVIGEVPWQMPGEGDVSSEDEAEVVSRYANQPGGAREGVQAAYKSLSKNVNAAAQTILAVPMEVYERTGDNGPLKAVVRAVPIAVLKPMIGASEAVSKTLLGMRNSLDPQGRDELGDKYK